MKWSLCNKKEMERFKRGTVITIVPEGILVRRLETGENVIVRMDKFISPYYKYPTEVIAYLSQIVNAKCEEIIIEIMAYNAITSICEVNCILY